MKEPLLVNDVLSPEDYAILTGAVSNPKSFGPTGQVYILVIHFYLMLGYKL